ncbi:MAG: 3-phosphoserine/phosphohydroxythreonine transaminase [Myxococcota bacterium]
MIDHRIHNFSSGPSILPREVLEQAAQELVIHPELGHSIMELSHRTPFWTAFMERTEADLRELLAIPDDYAVLFLQGGATFQFTMLPLNLVPEGGVVNMLHTGRWSQKAIAELGQLKRRAHIAASSEETQFDRIPTHHTLDEEGVYVHYVDNNTIYGTEYPAPPEVGDALLVCDASSNILSRPMDVARHGLIFAGAQKNLGPAGLTLVIIRRDLLDRATWSLPKTLHYRPIAQAHSMLNTPPVWPIYITGLVLRWLKRQGGAEVMAQRNADKAALLYQAIDETPLFEGCTTADSRSRMNVTFRLTRDALTPTFMAEAATHDLHYLKGHRSIGGCRAALYNAMPMESVQLLADFIRDFGQRHA